MYFSKTILSFLVEVILNYILISESFPTSLYKTLSRGKIVELFFIRTMNNPG